MTIYEQIQRGLDYLEAHLDHPVRQEMVARETGMSSRSFQHYFWMVTGFTYREYLAKRRLSRALPEVLSTHRPILEIALESGYQSHESFTRAFKREFHVSPREYRQTRVLLQGQRRLMLFKEIEMGLIVKELPETRTVTFCGFAPEPEQHAKQLLLEWLHRHPTPGKPRRIFGHNINREGQQEDLPENSGYKFYASLAEHESPGGGNYEVIRPGRFLVTGIEGSLQDNPAGEFITAGWERMQRIIGSTGYTIKEHARWFEEELEPTTSGNLRLDLYLEIEETASAQD